MVIDTSALVAVLFGEQERRAIIDAIEDAESSVLSAAGFVETSMVIGARSGEDGLRDLDLFLGRAAVEILPVDDEQAHVARRAFMSYGKGRHPAGLNFGDCFSYALAKTRGRPLLYKGADFAQTDVATVRY
ncbi:MAG: type II toxin-antitoxin system VapC family toxin [Acidimicrobiales bacterium]